MERVLIDDPYGPRQAAEAAADRAEIDALAARLRKAAASTEQRILAGLLGAQGPGVLRPEDLLPTPTVSPRFSVAAAIFGGSRHLPFVSLPGGGPAKPAPRPLAPTLSDGAGPGDAPALGGPKGV